MPALSFFVLLILLLLLGLRPVRVTAFALVRGAISLFALAFLFFIIHSYQNEIIDLVHRFLWWLTEVLSKLG